MAFLAALPAPGLAVYPNYIANKTEVIHLTRSGMSKTWEVRLSDGTPLMTIHPESMSASGRKTVSDSTGKPLGQIRRETWTSRYYFQSGGDGGPHLWDTESHFGFGGSRNTLRFRNAAGGRGESVQLDFKNSSWGKTSYVKWMGRDVAVVEKATRITKTEYRVTVAAGLDMFLVVGLMIAMDDKTRRSRAAAGASGGGGGGGC